MPVKKVKKIARPPHRSPAKAPEQSAKPKGKGGGKSDAPFDNTNRGVLFPNDKEGNERRPDYTGSADIEIPAGAKPGQVIKFRLSGWVKEYGDGKKLLSLTVQKADKQGGVGRSSKAEDDDEGNTEDEGGLLD